ncbi:putative transcriptional regulator [Gammaproteobacteria bacterium]
MLNDSKIARLVSFTHTIGMADFTSFLTNHFLIAMPMLADPDFFHTVTYICEHNPEGAMGIVINRPLALTVGEIFDQLNINPLAGDLPRHQQVFLGGTVQRERGFVIHQPIGNWEASLAVTDTIGITTSKDILQAMADGTGPKRSLVALGYSGWGAGQLEREIANNIWLIGPADLRVLFETPVERRWHTAAMVLGIDLNLLSGEVGHA